ncbi:hypothetical protein [Alcaligenes faecalis]|uniref:hypothetical protein n=1 Tax=Alcaligenes faecalis TaxID=511 RepID=UPI0005A6DC6F|nr:hypothetical protein [Alcaligenes faecalis]ATI00003.1 hypothetical protein CPY64_09795 [Alcaligenes faecalis]AYZ92789.1 hypothetical protein EGY22_15565 [Alcaligenes faecalis]MCX5593560.1 hypothetical protein [Alcaligenes faecalis]QQC31404.1 hypothetical protein I6H81_12130 [Alcaligenes faecalis]CAJ0905683.1 DUF1857 family protein [Alcaligenes faecalis subsp. faecalis]
MINNALATAYFAEGIRREVSGQHTIVGIYDDISEFTKLPIKLSKLSIIVTLSTLVERPFRPMMVRVRFREGETLFSDKIPEELRSHQQEAIDNTSKDSAWIYLKVVINLEDVEATEGSRLVVEFEDEQGDIARSNALTFKSHSKAVTEFGEQ